MKKILIATAVGLLAAAQVAAQESPWMVRARAVYIDMHNSDQVAHGALNLGVDNKTIPEVDVSYFFNKNLAAELILTTPQQGRVHTGTGTNLGSFKHLPPTLTLQYHFTNFNGYKPYLGAGLNYTKISNETLSGGYTLSQHSYGPALQAGVDIPLTKQISLNLDVKKVYMKTDVYSGNGGTTNNGTLYLNPVLFGVGVGYHF
jgi:outer membrane protein